MENKRLKNPEYAAGYAAAQSEYLENENKRKTSKSVTKNVRVRQLASNEYAVTEEIRFGEPDELRILQTNVSRVAAEDEVRLYYENMLGLNRFGDSGL